MLMSIWNPKVQCSVRSDVVSGCQIVMRASGGLLWLWGRQTLACSGHAQSGPGIIKLHVNPIKGSPLQTHISETGTGLYMDQVIHIHDEMSPWFKELFLRKSLIREGFKNSRSRSTKKLHFDTFQKFIYALCGFEQRLTNRTWKSLCSSVMADQRPKYSLFETYFFITLLI